MLVIGVTGGIGSGKSTVLDVFKEFGVMTISLDLLANEVMSTNSGVQCKLKRLFGDEAILENGTPNKKLISDQAFHSKVLLGLLNDIVHPEVYIRLRSMLNDLRIQEIPIVVIESPYPLRNFFNTLDCLYEKRIIYVHCDKTERIERVMKRNRISCKEAYNRVISLPCEEEYLMEADDLFTNESYTDAWGKARAEARYYLRIVENEKSK